MQIQEALQTGTLLRSGDRVYEVKKVLGQGGFGITYLATSVVDVDNIPIEAQFAIKEHYISSMNERQGTSVAISNANNTAEIKESIDSFIVEAQRLNKLSLNHPGIVRVNESFRANGTAYYVMEYIKGQSLREFVKHSSGGRLSEEEALKLFRPIAETIGYLHENKVTHLDIKPDNILIRENGQPVIIDFGLSKHYSSKGTPTSTIKAAGCSAGYSPMEQYVGITTFTPETDIYALAATLLYMLTGKDPIISTEITPDIIRNSLPVEVSEQTKEVIVKGMAKLKEDRMNNIQGFFTDTDSEASFTTISAPEDTNKTVKKKPASQKRKTQYTAEGNNPSAVSSPVKAIKLAFSRLFDFKGKSTRMEFWWFAPPFYFISLVMLLMINNIPLEIHDRIGYGNLCGEMMWNLCTICLFCVASFMTLGVSVRRLHHAGLNGLWAFIPYAFLIIFILSIEIIDPILDFWRAVFLFISCCVFVFYMLRGRDNEYKHNKVISRFILGIEVLLPITFLVAGLLYVGYKEYTNNEKRNSSISISGDTVEIIQDDYIVQDSLATD